MNTDYKTLTYAETKIAYIEKSNLFLQASSTEKQVFLYRKTQVIIIIIVSCNMILIVAVTL